MLLLILNAGFPSITNIEFDPTVQSLTCTVSATTVNWMRDGQPLTIDGSTYHTVTNRITSVESTNINENVLILNEPQSNIVGHTYTCTASSSGIKGTSSQDINIVLRKSNRNFNNCYMHLSHIDSICKWFVELSCSFK